MITTVSREGGLQGLSALPPRLRLKVDAEADVHGAQRACGKVRADSTTTTTAPLPTERGSGKKASLWHVGFRRVRCVCLNTA